LGWVAMSEREIRRIEVLSEVVSGRRTLVAAAAVLAVTPRHARRLLLRLQAGGGAALAFIKAQQDAGLPKPRVKTSSEVMGYRKRDGKPGRRSDLAPRVAAAPGLKRAPAAAE
jgi:hypothetical protein